MQAFPRWHPPSGTLGALVDRAHERARELVPRAASLRDVAERLPAPPSFVRALQRSDVAVIAEVKRRSPSKGEINAAIKTGIQATAYVNGGAAALSILTEPERFGGSLADLAEAHDHVTVPLLRKDFIVDAAQIVEARAHGASAVLLIARALDPAHLSDLMAVAAGLDLTALVEVRDQDELERALGLGATVIGVNNRNLETLEVDPANAARLIPSIPASVVAIAESAITSRSDVESVAQADAVLVGSGLSASTDPTAAVRALVGVVRLCRP